MLTQRQTKHLTRGVQHRTASYNDDDRRLLSDLVFEKTGIRYTEEGITQLNAELAPLGTSFEQLVTLPDPETHIHKQFREKSRAQHPDKQVTANEEFKTLNQARELALAFLPEEDKTKIFDYYPLVEAIRKIDYDEVQRLLADEKTNPNVITSFGRIGRRSFSPHPRSTGPVIFLAISLYQNTREEETEERRDLLQIISLLATYADLNMTWNMGERPLNYVAYLNNVELTKALLEAKYDHNDISPQDSPPLLDVKLNEPHASKVVLILGQDMIDKLEHAIAELSRKESSQNKDFVLEQMRSILSAARDELQKITQGIEAEAPNCLQKDNLRQFQIKIYHATRLVKNYSENCDAASAKILLHSAAHLNNPLLLRFLLRNDCGQNEITLDESLPLLAVQLDQPHADETVGILGYHLICQLENAILERKADLQDKQALETAMHDIITHAKQELESIKCGIIKKDFYQQKCKLKEFQDTLYYASRIIKHPNSFTHIETAFEPLRYAARLNNAALIRFFLDHGCDQTKIPPEETPILHEVQLSRPHADEAVGILGNDLIAKLNIAASVREGLLEEHKRPQFRVAVSKFSRDLGNELNRLKTDFSQGNAALKNFQKILSKATGAIQDLSEKNINELHDTLKFCNGKPLAQGKMIGSCVILLGILCGIAGIIAPAMFIFCALSLGIGATLFYHGTQRKMTKAVANLESGLRKLI